MTKIGDAELRDFIRSNSALTHDEMKVQLRAKGFSIGNDRFLREFRAVLAERLGVKDVELVEANIELAKKHQLQLDKNRIAAKAFRESARIDNTLTEWAKEIVNILTKYDFSKVTKLHETKEAPAAIIAHLSDLHLNELVQLPINSYDFRGAAKRLRKLAGKIRIQGKAYGVKEVVIVNTGDTLNSDRRLDEKLNMATNRMSAAMLAVDLLKQFILDLNKDFNINVIQVSGNESRANEEYGMSENLLNDNYDVLIFNILRELLSTAKGVTFRGGSVAEQVFSIMGKNVLAIHGEQIALGNPTADVMRIKGKYAQRGTVLDFVIFGHYHEADVQDHYARGGSLVGANAYSDFGLQLITKASQNLHIYFRNGEHDSHVCALQETEGVEGYDIEEKLARYNAKSEKKLHTPTVIHAVVV